MMIVSNYQETRRMADFYAPRGRSCCPVGWEVVSSIVIEIVWVWGSKRPILREKLPYCETNCSVPSRLKPEKLLPVIIWFIWNVRHQWSNICIFFLEIPDSFYFLFFTLFPHWSNGTAVRMSKNKRITSFATKNLLLLFQWLCPVFHARLQRFTGESWVL